MQIRSWDGSLVTNPAAYARPRSIPDVVQAVRDRGRHPSPVRALGSRHSVAACTAADGGTVVDMRGMNRILDIGPDHVRVQAGALYIDVAAALEARRLQFHVNTEIGNLTAGSAACCGTKDAAFTIGEQEEFGQVGSYVSAVTLVTASGEVVDVREDRDPELMALVRSSYGLVGIVAEVTFRVKPLQALAVSHRMYGLEDFLAALPDLRRQHQSLMMYILPASRTVLVELRSYRPDLPAVRRWPWRLRNFVWASAAPLAAAVATRVIPSSPLRHALLQAGGRALQEIVPHVIRQPDTVPSAQIIRYPPQGGLRAYVFTFWAFPEATYPDVLRQYCDFYVGHERRTGYRPNLLTVGYRVNQDRSSLLSYSADGPVITIDPVSTGDPGWEGFLRAYNDFASARGGVPLLNQTPLLTPAQAARAFGARLETLRRERRRLDPEDRFLSPYFRNLLGDS